MTCRAFDFQRHPDPPRAVRWLYGSSWAVVFALHDQNWSFQRRTIELRDGGRGDLDGTLPVGVGRALWRTRFALVYEFAYALAIPSPAFP